MSPVKTALAGLLLAAGVIIRANAEPAPACGPGMPPSAMTFMDAKFGRIEEVVDAGELAAAKGKAEGHAGAGFLLVDPSVRGWLSVEHRVVRSPSEPNVFCDAPYRVQVALGFGERRLLVSKVPAANSCVMEALRAHESLHAAVEEPELAFFIDTHTPAVGAAMAKLKSSSAPSVEMAKKQFEAAGLPLVRALERRLLARKAELRREVDTAGEMARMAGVCGGAIGGFDAGGIEAM